MQIGNPKELDAARNALRDAFDEVWMSSPVAGHKERRAIRCALALDAPRLPRGNWTLIFNSKGEMIGRITGAHNDIIRA